MGVYIYAHTYLISVLVSTSVFGGTKASFRRNPKPCEDNVVSSAKNFQLLHPWLLFLGLGQCGTGVAVSIGLPGSDTVLFARRALVCSMSFLKGPIVCGPCGSPQSWPYIWALLSSVLFPLGLDQEEDRVLLTPSYYLFPFPLLSFFANASI